MKIKQFKYRIRKQPYFSSLFLMMLLLVNFQNCSQPGAISTSVNSSVTDRGAGNQGADSNVPMKAFSSETFVNTDLNTPVDFELSPVIEEKLTGVRIIDQKFSAANGALMRIDQQSLKFRYTPNNGYRGSDYSIINAVDDRGETIAYNIKIVIANPVQNLKPALAIRGMGCIQCHAKVESNIVTDFGYGSPYFFSANFSGSTWKSGGIYGDHQLNFSTMDLNSNIKVLVPKSATLPNQVATGTGASTLAQYISNQLSVSGNQRTKAVSVVEKSLIYIGSPTDTDIVNAFSMQDTDRFVYFKNSDNSLALSGLSDQKTYFKNGDILNCEGDLALRGPVYFNNLQINSASGCRLYVIGSVFIYGPITQLNTSDNRNLQITSTKSISMGLGLTKMNNKSCEPGSRYDTDPSSYNVSSLVNRYVTFWTDFTYQTRTANLPIDAGKSIIAESAAIEKQEGLLYDASCRPEGRNISFDRLLLNAPAIHSRYEGDFSGTLIAEYAIMSLGQFKFQYDQVFDRVPILPMLKQNIYLDIQ